MTIPYLPGIADEMQRYMPQLTEGIKTAINPNWQLQEEMRRATAMNPQLAKQLADLEAQAPGTLQQLGLGKLSGTIGSLGPSFEYQQQQEKQNAIKTVNADPTLARERQQGLAGVRTDDAREMAGINIQSGKIGVESGQLTLDQQREQAQQMEIWKGYLPEINQIAHKHKGNLFQAMRAGDLQGEALNAAYNLPQFKAILDGQRVDYWNEEGNALRRRQLAQADADLEYRKSRTSDKAISSELAQRFHGETAQHIAEFAGADFQQVYDLLSNPELRNDQRYQSAAAAIDEYRANLGKKDYKDVMIRWENQSEIYDRIIMNRLAGDSMRRQAIEQKNEAAKRVFGAFGLEAPQWDFDDAWYRAGKVKLAHAPNWMEQFGFNVGPQKIAKEDKKTAADTTGTRQSPPEIVTPKPGAGGRVQTSSTEERKSGLNPVRGLVKGAVDFVDNATRPTSGPPPAKADSAPKSDPYASWKKLKQENPDSFERRVNAMPPDAQKAIRAAVGG